MPNSPAHRAVPALRHPPLSLRGRVLLHSAIQIAGRVGNGLGAAVLVWLLSRYLGLGGFGRYTSVTSFVALFYILTDLGIQQIATRDAARDEKQAGHILGLALALRLALSLLALAALIAVALAIPNRNFHLPGVQLGIAIAGLTLVASPFLSAANAVYQIVVRMTVPAAADALARYVSLALVALLALGLLLPHAAPAVRLDAVLAASTAGVLASSLFAYLAAQRSLRILPTFRRPAAVRMLRQALPVAIVSVLGLIHYRIDVPILTLMGTIRTVGEYGVAVKVLDVALGGLAPFMGLVYPILSRRMDDPALLQRAFQKALEFILIIGLGGAVFVSFLAHGAVHLLGHGQFMGAVPAVRIIAWAIPITFAETLLAQMVVAVDRQLQGVPIMLGITALNIGLNVLLIPHLHATAPALVTVVTDGLGMIGMAVVVRRAYGFWPQAAPILRILLAAAAAALVLAVISAGPLVPAALAGAAAYVVALLLLRVVGPADLRAALGAA